MYKSLIILGSLVCLFAGQLNAQRIYPSGVPGCVGRWTFTQNPALGGTILDESGNGCHGLNIGRNITITEGWRGIPNTAGNFNGTNSYCVVPHESRLQTPYENTMIALVRFNSFNSQYCQYNQILAKGEQNGGLGTYGFGVGDAPYDNDCLIYSPSKMQLYPHLGQGMITTPAGNFLELNKWYFLATIISPTTIKNYVVFMDPNLKQDAIQPVDSIPGSFYIGDDVRDLIIGAQLSGFTGYFVDGAMDEVILFNRALSPSEMYSVYNYLYSSTTAINDQPLAEKNIAVYTQNGKCIINTARSRYSYEIYNSVGQLIARKKNCSGMESFELSHYAAQLLFVKVLDEQNRMHHFKVSLD